MIVFLYGPDSYARKNREHFFLAEFEKKYSGLAVGDFDLSEPGIREACVAFMQSSSLFESKKIACIRGLDGLSEEDAKRFAKDLSPFVMHPDITILSVTAKKPTGPFAKFLKNAFKAEEFPLLSGDAWRAFVAREARAHEVLLAPDALVFLAEAYEGDAWRLVTELQKLSCAAHGRITKADLDAFGIEVNPEFFSRIREFVGPDLSGRMHALEDLLNGKEDPARIFSTAAYQNRSRLREMAHYDVLVKSGKLGYEEALLFAALSPA